MVNRLTTGIFFASLIYGAISAKVREFNPPDVPVQTSLSAFEKTYLASVSEVVQSDHLYSGKTRNTLLIKNVGFGVFGAKNVTVGFNLDNEDAKKANVQFRINGENGQLISSLNLIHDGASPEMRASAPVTPVKGYHDLYVSYSSEVKGNFSWFQFEVSGPNPEEYYVLTSLFNGQAISASGLTVNSYTEVKPYTYGLQQMIRFTKTLFGSYYITNRHTEFNLDLNAGQLFNDTVYLYQNKPNSHQSQEWYIDTAGDGSVKIMSRISGRCVTIHTNLLLIQQPCRNETNQKWYFMPVC